MIELKNIAYAYPVASGEAPQSLKGANLTLNAGEIVALVGANGAGKSTLGKVLCGTYEPASGGVYVDGSDTPATSDELHHLVAYVRQDPTSQLVAPRVFEEVAFGPCNLGLSEDEVRERVAVALRQVGLSGFDERLVSELSGGELQRLAIAGVLAMHPAYIVMDEVTSQLDNLARAELRSIIEAQAATGTGILLMAHDAIEVMRAHRVVLLEEGKVSWEGTPAEFFASTDLVERACMKIPAAPQFRKLSPAPPTPEILLQDVSVRFEQNPALKDFSLTAYQGQILLVAGRSGSGKSTLASVCAGLLEPDSGVALYDGKPIKVGSVGLCMQRPEAQLFCDTVLDDVAFGPKNMGVALGQALERSQTALSALGLSEELWSTSPFALSGGQRRRAALAGIVSLDTKVLVFDEPTVGLDAKGCAQLKEVIKSYAELGKCVIVVSHDVDLWLDAVHAVVLIQEGKLLWSGAPEELYRQKLLLEKAGLGTPMWEQFAAELKRQNSGTAAKSKSAKSVKTQGGGAHE